MIAQPYFVRKLRKITISKLQNGWRCLIIIDNFIKFIKMTTDNHSTILKRLSRTIDTSNRNHSQLDSFYSQTLKLPTLHAVNKSVKYNDISFVTSRKLDKLRKQPDQPDNIEQEAVHQTLTIVRKKYDDIKRVKQEHARLVEILQIQKQKYLNQKNNLNFQKNQAEKNVTQTLTQLNNIKLHLQQTEGQKKIMLNMVARLKSDKIVYDLRKNNYQKKLIQYQRQKQIIIKQSMLTQQEEDNTKQVYSKFIQNLQEEKTERQLHMSSLSTMIHEKQSVIENAEIRKNQMKEISQVTLQDKDIKQKNWYRVYLCHRFISHLLNGKMAREMNKFSAVQTAFKNIKTTTGVGNTQELVTKFLSKQQVYGQLLGKIAQDQRRIQQLNREKNQIDRETKKLIAEYDNLGLNKKQMINLSQQQKDLIATTELSQKNSINVNKMYSWINKNSKKLSISHQQPQASSLAHKLQIFKGIFVIILQKIQKELQQTKSIGLGLGQFETQVVQNKSNFRIKVQEQVLDQHNTNPQNEEEDFMNKQHQQIIRNNEKFMKDVKKKYEQIKILQLEQEPKKKEIIIEKPKLPAPQQN